MTDEAALNPVVKRARLRNGVWYFQTYGDARVAQDAVDDGPGHTVIRDFLLGYAVQWHAGGAYLGPDTRVHERCAFLPAADGRLENSVGLWYHMYVRKSYARVTLTDGRKLRLEVVTDSARFLTGYEVSVEGERVAPKTATHPAADERLHLIDKALIKRVTPLTMNLTYGMLFAPGKAPVSA